MSKETCKRLNALCGRLTSAFKTRKPFRAVYQTYSHEVISFEPREIENYFDAVAGTDRIRHACMVRIACDYLYDESLHHRIPAWLAQKDQPFRDEVIRSIRRFRLSSFTALLEPFLDSDGSNRRDQEKQAALKTLGRLQPEAFYEKLLARLVQGDPDMIKALDHYERFDRESYYREHFRKTSLVDEKAILDAYARGELSHVEASTRREPNHAKFKLAKQYGPYSKQEVLEFYVQELNFHDNSYSFSGVNSGGTSICAKGWEAALGIATLNGWIPEEPFWTNPGWERKKTFILALQQKLIEDPSPALSGKCPLDYPPATKDKQLQLWDKLSEEYPVLIQEGKAENYRIAANQEQSSACLFIRIWVGNSFHARIVKLTNEEVAWAKESETNALRLFYRYSHFGSLVLHHDRMLLNSDDFESREAASTGSVFNI